MRGTENVSTPAAGSIMAFMKQHYPEYEALNNALNAAISSLETAKNSGVAFIDNPAHAQVKTCIDAVQELDDQLNLAATWCARNIMVK